MTLFETIRSVILVAFFFGFCIFIHEFGHLLAALWRGLHVERFSIGFGKPIKTWRYRNIDWLISWLPFGGYVALPQLDPSDQPTTSDGRPLPVVKPLDRIIVAFAGPLFNVLFGLFLATIIWLVGVPGSPIGDSFIVDRVEPTYVTKAGETLPTPEYAAGLRPGDRVVAVNGKPFKDGYAEAAERIVLAPGSRVALTVKRGGETLELSYVSAPNPEFEYLGFPFFVAQQKTRIAWVEVDSPAHQAGLLPGDEVVSVNGIGITSSVQLIKHIRGSEGVPQVFVVLRGEERLTLPAATPRLVTLEGDTAWRLGFMPDDLTILHPTPWQQLTNVVVQTGKTLRRLVDRASLVQPKHMSGPVGIVHRMTQVFAVDFMIGLRVVALISFSLALVNLLPIPVLDGGHILLACIEGVIRRRVPYGLVSGVMRVGAVLIISFALYITFFDVARLFRF